MFKSMEVSFAAMDSGQATVPLHELIAMLAARRKGAPTRWLKNI